MFMIKKRPHIEVTTPGKEMTTQHMVMIKPYNGVTTLYIDLITQNIDAKASYIDLITTLTIFRHYILVLSHYIVI